MDSRFSNLVTSSDYHIDPSSSNFKKTDGMSQIINHVQNKRIQSNNDAVSILNFFDKFNYAILCF